MYGLEVLLLSKKQIDSLSTYQISLLKQIQGLPKRTANSGVYLLIGAVPIKALLDLKMLSVIGAIARSANKTLKELAVRQVAARTPKTSWFAKTESILHKYGLPD